MTRTYETRTETSYLAGIRKGFDITPSADELNIHTRGIMVNTDGATITGIFVEDGNEPHTTFPLTAGVLYPFGFMTIISVSSGTVKGYA